MAKSRVLLCTSGGICATLSLQALLDMDEVEVVGLFLSTRTRSRNGNFIGDAARIIKVSGFKYALYLGMGTAIFDCMRLPGCLPTAKQLARQNGIPLFCSRDINSELSQAWLIDQKPDLFLSSFFNLKLSPKTLSIPKKAAVNLHPALLPAYKGVDPVFYYFLNSENRLGISLHHMAEDFDTGQILAQTNMFRNPQKSVFWHNTELFRLGLKLFSDWLENSNEAKQLTNTRASDQYDSWPSPRQVHSLKQPLYRISDLWEQAQRPFKAKS